MKNRITLILVVAVLLCLAGWTTHAQLQKSAPTRPAWEYLEVELDANFQATPKLNQYGIQGWELVNVLSSCPSSPEATYPCRYWAYMKRQK